MAARGRKENHSYTIVVERDSESGWLVGEVVELPGCYTQAPDIAGLEANIAEAIRAYLLANPKTGPSSTFLGTWRVEIAA